MQRKYRVVLRKKSGVTITGRGLPRVWGARRIFERTELEPGDEILLQRRSRRLKSWQVVDRRTP